MKQAVASAAFLVVAIAASGCSAPIQIGYSSSSQSQVATYTALKQLQTMGFKGAKHTETATEGSDASQLGSYEKPEKASPPAGAMFFSVIVGATCNIVLMRDPQGRFYWPDADPQKSQAPDVIVSESGLKQLMGQAYLEDCGATNAKLPTLTS